MKLENPNSAESRAMQAKKRMNQVVEQLRIQDEHYDILTNFGIEQIDSGYTRRVTLNITDTGDIPFELLNNILSALVRSARADVVPENIELEDPQNCVQLRYDHEQRRYIGAASVYLCFEP
jgi:hypothetical protein